MLMIVVLSNDARVTDTDSSGAIFLKLQHLEFSYKENCLQPAVTCR